MEDYVFIDVAVSWCCLQSVLQNSVVRYFSSIFMAKGHKLGPRRGQIWKRRQRKHQETGGSLPPILDFKNKN